MDRRLFLTAAVGLGTVTAMPAIAGGHGRLGKFKGLKGHVTTGTAEVLKDSVQLLGDFTFDGAPDPKVALGKDGYDKRTLMGPLKKNKGASAYKLPKGVNPDDYNEVWIWCEKFNVPLGVAKLG